jgi:hypothetical protein
MVGVNTSHTPEEGANSLSWPDGLIIINTIIENVTFFLFLDHYFIRRAPVLIPVILY